MNVSGYLLETDDDDDDDDEDDEDEDENDLTINEDSMIDSGLNCYFC
jgi:hypothetical protein